MYSIYCSNLVPCAFLFVLTYKTHTLVMLFFYFAGPYLLRIQSFSQNKHYIFVISF